MRSNSISRILERMMIGTAFLLLLLLPRNFATSNDVIATDNDDCDVSAESAHQRSTGTNNRRCNGTQGNSNPERRNTTRDELYLKELQERYIRMVRDRERHRQNIMQRTWDYVHQPVSAGVQISSLGDIDFRKFESMIEVDNQENDTDESVSITYIYSSLCSGPRNFSGARNDGTNFRLFFKVEPIEATHRQRETKIVSALLFIKRKMSAFHLGHRPALTSGRAGRTRTSGILPSGRTSLHRRRPTRDTGEATTSSSSSSSRSDSSGGVTDNLRIIVNSLSRSNKKNRQEMRTAAVTSVARNSTDWIQINLTQVVDDWIRRPVRNLGLQIIFRSEGSTELNPYDFVERINCLATSTDIASRIQLPQLESYEKSFNDSIVDWMRIHLDNITHPFLEVATVEVPRTRPRHGRDLKTDSSSEHRAGIPSNDADHFKSLMLAKWIRSLETGEKDSPSSRTHHRSFASNSGGEVTAHSDQE